ncbi:ricin B lectin domain-containing protein [Cokeromyces recurvatus]|uniref:ricin B lectin domain-containing protein n=1 Tax=Cokeromyces recurvatus TaxID=90255 RepID=UPI00221F96E4|nr:ricin B lectin domain-containing protein [Cokeromyces recurvatus]KAI7900590.1 ricin B lectin domain-containing protein [Cokeromyces recurvatus]
MFPEGLFYILSRKHGFALDVYDGQTKDDANIIVWPQKFQDSDNQLWSYEKGRLINKKSGLALDISSSAFKKDKTIVQKKIKANKQSQEWIYDQGFICSKEFPSLVLDIRGDSAKGGAQVLLYRRKATDNLNQLWQFEPYHQFENALNMAATSMPLHKKEGFGQPRPGYGAEPGVPPELTQVPENNKIAGVGNNPTSTSVNSGNSRVDPVLSQYGSFYGGTPTAPPKPQPGQQAPSLPPKNVADLYPPPSHQPTSPINTTSTYPPSQNNNNDHHHLGYPPPSGNNTAYPPPSSSNYQQHQGPPPPPPLPPLSSSVSNSYPPPSGYPPSSVAGYPPSPVAGYPPPSPSNYMNTTTAYPPNTSNMPGYPSAAASFPEPHQNEYYQQDNSHGFPPPLPPNRPNNTNNNTYGYPSYPQ